MLAGLDDFADTMKGASDFEVSMPIVNSGLEAEDGVKAGYLSCKACGCKGYVRAWDGNCKCGHGFERHGG